MQRLRGLSGVSVAPGAFRTIALLADDGQPVEASRRVRATKIARGVVVGIAAMLLLAAAGLLIAQQRYAGHVYPSVTAGSVEVGGLTVEQARAAIQADAKLQAARTVTLRYQDKSWTPTFADLGITIDVDQTLAGAYDIGREDTARSRLTNLAGLMRADHAVPLVVMVNQQTLNNWFDRVDGDLGLKPHDAYLVIDGANVSIQPEVQGVVVDRAKMGQIVSAGAQSLTIADGNLPVSATIPNVRAGDLTALQGQVQTALAKGIKLKYPGKHWTLKPEEISQFLTQSTDPSKQGAAAVTVTVDESKLASWLSDQFSGDINQDPVDAQIAWSDDTQSVYATTPSEDGAKLKPLTFARAVIASFWGNHDTVDIPVADLKPQIDSNNLAALGITTKLAVGDSNFVGSSDERATNIQVGVGLLNGTLVPPHGTFSFNHAIGEITLDKGYVEGGIIDGQRIGRDVGGGICQVSTTVFRAALYAGVPIVEWWPHTYRLNFYEQDGWEPGYDASILQPDGNPFGGGDFRFSNPTDSWMLVEAYTTDDQRVYVIIYGAETGYKVSFSPTRISDPIPTTEHDIETVDDTLPSGTVEQTEASQPGYDVQFDRTVTDKGGNVIIQETYDSEFASRPNVYKVSPDMQGKSPASENGGDNS
jgi:vancomycin resistance protein YoaR